ncbi:hypothetical protein N9512_02630 [Amylibacter sp.]|nr:hypothetical protein [Amylibacter sp.]
MMKTILTAVCLLIASMTASYSFEVSKQVTPSKIDSIAVFINDGAKQGCWTNLGEAKRYAEDKLELAGFTVRSSNDKWTPKGYALEISVASNRVSSADCYGNISITLYQPNWIDGVYGHFEVGEGGGVYMGYKNANQNVLDYIQRFIDAFPK